MSFSSSEREGVLVIVMEGNIMGGPEAYPLREFLHDAVQNGKKNIVIDLSQVARVNSSGLGMLIGALTTMKNADGSLKLAGANDTIQHLISITKLSSVFETYSTVDEAVSSYAR